MVATLPKKERGAEVTKARIVAAAVAEFSAKGFGGARLSSVAHAADVQAALIHHYYADKEGLFRAALQHALAPMSAEVWGVLERVDERLRGSSFDARTLRELTVGLVQLVEQLYARHHALLAMLRHEAERDGAAVRELVAQTLRPPFEGTVRYLESLQERGALARFDARQLCLFVLGAVGVFTTDPALVAGLAPGADELDVRRAELVALVVARVTP